MIILASSSPRRKELLTLLGLDFTIDASEIEEKLDPRFTPSERVARLSQQKAAATGKKYKEGIIIAADTMVFFNNELIGKPKDAKDATKMLQKLSGTVHSIITGFTILDAASGKRVTKAVETKIWFRKLSSQEITKFIEREKPFDKAGAYAAHELGAIFIEKVEGDFLGAVGLPISSVAKELKKFGVQVL